MKQGLVMGVLVEPLPTFAGPSNEEVTLFHNYRLNCDKTAGLLRLNQGVLRRGFAGAYQKPRFYLEKNKFIYFIKVS